VYLLSISAFSSQSALDWWPRIDAVYCHSVELRSMFSETLHKAIQGCGAHPAIRMPPVRLVKKLLKHKPLAFPMSPFHYGFLFINCSLETSGGKNMTIQKATASHTRSVNSPGYGALTSCS